MSFSKKLLALLAPVAIVAMSACNGAGAGPSSPLSVTDPALAPANDRTPATDTTSILKRLKKDVVIGSTVDPTNGDEGPRGASVVSFTYGGLKKGQVLVCNFENSSGVAGKGTTIDVLDPTPGSKPATFAQSSDVEGCDDDSVSPASNYVYASAFRAHDAVQFTPAGKVTKTWGKPLVDPFALVDAACTGGASHCDYSAEYIFASDAKTGGIVDFSVNDYGDPHEIQVATGFGVNKKSGWSTLGPSGLQWLSPKSGTLYIADGVDNTVVSFNHATALLVTDEIVVKKGGKTFKCKFPKSTCATLIYSGSPLNAPVAMALLPNGNLVVANTAGGNTLVELTNTGKVLDTKVVDKGNAPAIFGLAAIGTTDSNTALYYTDTNDNSLHELEQ